MDQASDDPVAIAHSSEDRGAAMFRAGDYPAAERLYREALAKRRAAQGATHVDTARCAQRLAMVLRGKAAYAEAVTLLREAIAALGERLGAQHPDTAAATNDLGITLHDQGDLAAAERLLRDALAVRQATLGADHPDTARSLYGLGILLQAKGALAEADSRHREALAIQRKALGEEHADTAESMVGLANVLLHKGDYAMAGPLHRQALAIRQRLFGHDHPLTAESLNALAVLLRLKGDLPEAEQLYRQALDIHDRRLGRTHPGTLLLLSNLGILLRIKGDNAGAEQLLREAVAGQESRVGRTHRDTLVALSNYAGMLRVKSDYAGAAEIFREVLQVRRQTIGPAHPDTLRCMNNLAAVLGDKGDHAEAEMLCREMLEGRERTLGPSHPETMTSVNNLAGILRVRGNYVAAEPLFRRALDAQEQKLGPVHPETAIILNNLVTLLRAKGDHVEAERLLAEADERASLLLQTLATSSGRVRLMALDRDRSQVDARIAGALACRHMVPSSACDSLRMVLRRKGLGLEAGSMQQLVLLEGRYPDLREPAERLRALNDRIVRAELSEPAAADASAYRTQLEAWRTEAEDLERELARSIPEMQLDNRLRVVDPAAVASHLGPDQALIELVWFRPYDFRAGEKPWGAARYAAFVLRPQDGTADVKLHDLGEAAEIEVLVRQYRGLMRAPDARLAIPATQSDLQRQAETRARRSQELRAAGSALRRRVFDPLVEALAGARHLVIASDGELGRFAFEGLPLDDGGYVLDRYAVSYVGSGRDVLRWAAQRPWRAEPPVVIAGPDYWAGSASAGADEDAFRSSGTAELGVTPLTPLPHALSEGEVVSTLLGCNLVSGAAATKDLVLSATSPWILHMATHGAFLQDLEHETPAEIGSMGSRRLRGGKAPANPMLRSMLAFAGANVRPLSQGYLTAAEASGLDLRGTELVVLSACETGLGETRVGEGVFGLQRAFVLAGAASLVMSLWEVPDAATKELMVAFYASILRGEGRAAALRAAQQEISINWPDPAYWAGFVCLGNPGPIRPREP